MNKDFFDSLGLNQKQREAVVTDADALQIIAGAGTGKTRTLVSKVKYLIEKRGISANDILVLSYSRNTVDDLIDRLNEIDVPTNGMDDVTVSTFHSFGYRFLNEKYDEKLLGTVFKQFIKSKVIHDISIFEKLKLYFREKFYHNKKYYYPFNVFAKQKDFYFSRNSIRSLNNTDVRTEEDFKIANFLTLNSIEFQYEKKTLKNYPGNKTIVYDFYLPQYDIYIEDIRLDKDSKPFLLSKNRPKSVSPSSLNRKSERYIRQMNYKLNFFNNRKDQKIYKKVKSKDNPILKNKEGDKLIVINSYLNKNYLDDLKGKLIESGVKLNHITENQLNYFLKRNRFYSGLENIKKHFDDSIKSFKEGIVTKESLLSHDFKTDKSKFLFSLLLEYFDYYENFLKEHHIIDFTDMIVEAIPKIKDINYKYILVDEYQDISESRYRLLKKAKEISGAKLVVVGDDWQSIYSFSGCDVKFFTNFKNDFNDLKIIFLDESHRFSNQLIKSTSDFIKNDNLSSKELFSNKSDLDDPIELRLYSGRNKIDKWYNEISLIFNILKELSQDNENREVMILSRYNENLDFIKNRLEDSNIGDLGLDISFNNFHTAKGLDADNVIILDVNHEMNGKGIPNSFESSYNSSFISFLDEDEKLDEEKRLFYVALTRTKNKVFLCADKNKLSPFIKELNLTVKSMDKLNESISFNSFEYEIEYYWEKRARKSKLKKYECPICGEEIYLYLINSHYYIVCSDFKDCGWFVDDQITNKEEVFKDIRVCKRCHSGFLYKSDLNDKEYSCSNSICINSKSYIKRLKEENQRDIHDFKHLDNGLNQFGSRLKHKQRNIYHFKEDGSFSNLKPFYKSRRHQRNIFDFYDN